MLVPHCSLIIIDHGEQWTHSSKDLHSKGLQPGNWNPLSVQIPSRTWRNRKWKSLLPNIRVLLILLLHLDKQPNFYQLYWDAKRHVFGSRTNGWKSLLRELLCLSHCLPIVHMLWIIFWQGKFSFFIRYFIHFPHSFSVWNEYLHLLKNKMILFLSLVEFTSWILSTEDYVSSR